MADAAVLEGAPAEPVVRPNEVPPKPKESPPAPGPVKAEEEEPIEEGAIDAYMDEENAPASERPSAEEWKAYLEIRYDEIKTSYKTLQLHLREAEIGKREDLIPGIRSQFNQNYRNRKIIVRELRKAGVKIEDRFVAQ